MTKRRIGTWLESTRGQVYEDFTEACQDIFENCPKTSKLARKVDQYSAARRSLLHELAINGLSIKDEKSEYLW